MIEHQFNPFDPSFQATRYDQYRFYRENDPFHWGVAGIQSVAGSWYAFSYRNVVSILRDPRFGKHSPHIDLQDRNARIPDEHRPLSELTAPWMLLRDPPEHSLYREVFQKAYRRHFNDKFVSRVEVIADELTTSLRGKRHFDLMESLAIPLPVRVICELLGIPSEYQSDVRRWSRLIFDSLDLKDDTTAYQSAADAAEEVSDLLREIIKHRRRARKDDIISTVVGSEAARKLSDQELAGNISLFLLAGQETAVGLIGNGVRALLQARNQWDKLVRNPDMTTSAVDEILRTETPVQIVTRFAQVDVHFAGKSVNSGDLVCLVLGAANRDLRQFPDADRFDISRSPNNHLGFGYGRHYCVGSMLGHTEGRLALRALLKEKPDLRVEDSPPAWTSSITFRSLRRLPLICDDA